MSITDVKIPSKKPVAKTTGHDANLKASEIAAQLTALVYQQEGKYKAGDIIEAYEKCLAAVKKGIE